MPPAIDHKNAKYIEFLADLVPLLEKHNVQHIIVIADINEQIRNTYISPTKKEKQLFCSISDCVDCFLTMTGAVTKDPDYNAIGKNSNTK